MIVIGCRKLKPAHRVPQEPEPEPPPPPPPPPAKAAKKEKEVAAEEAPRERKKPGPKPKGDVPKKKKTTSDSAALAGGGEEAASMATERPRLAALFTDPAALEAELKRRWTSIKKSAKSAPTAGKVATPAAGKGAAGIVQRTGCVGG